MDNKSYVRWTCLALPVWPGLLRSVQAVPLAYEYTGGRQCCAICPVSELLSPPRLPGLPKLPRLCESCDQSTGSEEHPHLPEWPQLAYEPCCSDSLSIPIYEEQPGVVPLIAQ